MGAWGIGSFDNDDASDFIDEVLELDGQEALVKLTTAVFAATTELREQGSLDETFGSMAVAACEVFAILGETPQSAAAPTKKASKKKTDDDDDDDANAAARVTAWCRRQTWRPPAKVMALAVDALKAVTSEDSELRELWEESDDAKAWRASIKALKSRLEAARQQAAAS